MDIFFKGTASFAVFVIVVLFVVFGFVFFIVVKQNKKPSSTHKEPSPLKAIETASSPLMVTVVRENGAIRKYPASSLLLQKIPSQDEVVTFLSFTNNNQKTTSSPWYRVKEENGKIVILGLASKREGERIAAFAIVKEVRGRTLTEEEHMILFKEGWKITDVT